MESYSVCKKLINKSQTYSQEIECLQQLHDKLYNESLTNPQQFDNTKRVYDMSTIIQQIDRMETEQTK